MAGLHAAAQGTLGAAVGLAVADAERNQLRYLAVGNTRAAKLGAQAWRGVSRDGVLGERLPPAFEQTVPLGILFEQKFNRPFGFRPDALAGWLWWAQLRAWAYQDGY